MRLLEVSRKAFEISWLARDEKDGYLCVAGSD